MSFDELIGRFCWTSIRNCPGRWSLRMSECDAPPETLAGPGAPSRRCSIETIRNEVAVTWLEGGGLISYRKADGRWLHTLNDAGGLERKLRQLGIAPRAPYAGHPVSGDP